MRKTLTAETQRARSATQRTNGRGERASNGENQEGRVWNPPYIHPLLQVLIVTRPRRLGNGAAALRR
jgi:hypothetical protein